MCIFGTYNLTINKLALKKIFFSSILLLALSVLLISWGYTGHYKISETSSLSFNTQMQDFLTWVDFLSDHSSDADFRKDSDPTEGPKHYIDIDNYSEFITTGRIPQTLDSAVTIHGYSFVQSNGFLPWATKTSFDSLTVCLQRRDFTKAQIFAADLGHYVADGYMPLHITKNYNGQLTGNTGIHSRFESTMINANISQIVYTGDSATAIADVNQFIFDYLYANYIYCDSILLADNYAKTFSTSYSSTEYKTALWNKSRSFTIPLFQRASKSLATLIYSAWLQAGSPPLSTASVAEPDPACNAILFQNMPNPFTASTIVSYNLSENAPVTLSVFDINGKKIETLVQKSMMAGSYTVEWKPGRIPAGMYYLVLQTGEYFQVKKVVFSGRE